MPVRTASVSIHEVVEGGHRLEASVYATPGRQLRQQLLRGSWPTKSVLEMVTDAWYPGRFKRDYVKATDAGAMGFLGSSEMLSVRPEPVKFMSTLSADPVRVRPGQVLLSRSGTIGNVTLVTDTLSRFLVSEHAIRLEGAELPGYLYAFLRSDIGRAVVETNNYGAVVSQVEPEHLRFVPVPQIDKATAARINLLILESFELRDNSNELLDEAQSIFRRELGLPVLDTFRDFNYLLAEKVEAFSVPSSQLAGRLEASFHRPSVAAIESHIASHAQEVRSLGDPRLSSRIVLPGRFKRVYVGPGHGAVFIGGKQIGELDPVNKKYLAFGHHQDRIQSELLLQEGMILVTCSGTIGRVGMVPRHWNGWTANQHVLRVVPACSEVAGYLYAWLSSDYGREQIRRYTYGAVIDEITDTHLASVAVPLLEDGLVQEVNKLVLDAMELRFEAYSKEQEAMGLMNSVALQGIGVGVSSDRRGVVDSCGDG